MKHAEYIYNELKEISPFLASLEKMTVFSVPKDYFLQLDTEILRKIIPEQFHVLPASKPPSFTVPDGYFENLAGNILQKINTLDSDHAGTELKQISPILYSAKDDNVFTVPPEYFSTFVSNIIQVVKPQAKVVILKKRSIVWNCAAAAMLTGIMAISALWTSNPVSQSEVTADINIKNAQDYKNQQQINEGIANLSDADIVRYLEITGINGDDEAVTAGIPEKDLPDELDYLSNDNTLQIFLEKAGLKNNQN